MINFLPDYDRHGKSREDFYIDEKERYTEETFKAFESEVKHIYSRAEYAYIAACQYLEDGWTARSLFQRLGLTRLHAVAVACSTKYELDKFTDELDAIIEDNAGDAE